MVLVTKSQAHPQSQSQSQPSSSSSSSNPKRRSLFGGLARRRQSTDDSSDNNQGSNRRSASSSSAASSSSPPPLPSSPPPHQRYFNANSNQQQQQQTTNQWPDGPQSLDDWVSKTGSSKVDETVSQQQGRGARGVGPGPGGTIAAGNASISRNNQFQSNSKGSPTMFASEEWDSMQYVLDRVEDGSMINSTDSPPNPQSQPQFNNSRQDDSEQTFPLGRVSLDLLVHDPSSTKPFDGVQPRPRQDSAPQLVHSRHRSHFSIPDVVVTAAEEEGEGQHFEVKVPAAKRRSFVLNVHNPQISSMPTNNSNGVGVGASSGGFAKKIKGGSKLKPLIQLDHPASGSTALSGSSPNSIAEENSAGPMSNSSSANSTLSKAPLGSPTSDAAPPTNRKGKKTFSLFGKKSSPAQSQQQPPSPTYSNPGGAFYSANYDSTGSLPTSSSASGADSSKESLAMKTKDTNQSSGSPPTSNSSDGESTGGFSGMPRAGIPTFSISPNGVPPSIKSKGNPSSSATNNSPNPSSNYTYSPQSSAPTSPNPASSDGTMTSPKKLSKKEQKQREKQELELIKQVEKVDKMVRQHDEKEKKREKKEREKMRKNGTLDSMPSEDVAPKKTKSKMRRLTIFSAASKAGPAAASQQAQIAALERRNSARRSAPRPPSGRASLVGSENQIDQRQHNPQQQQQQQGREPDQANFSFPPRNQQVQGPNSSSSPSTISRPRPPRSRPPPLTQDEDQVQSQRPLNNAPPPTIVLTSPSSPVRTSFSEAYPQPSSAPQSKTPVSPVPVLSGVGDTMGRSSQEWQDLTSPTEGSFPLAEGAKNVDWKGNFSQSQGGGVSRSTSLQRALAYTHAEEGMIRKKASLRRRGSKRSVGGGTGSARSSIVDEDGNSVPHGVQKKPSFLRKGSGSVKQVDGDWEEEEDEATEISRSLSSDGQDNDGSVTPRAGNSSPRQSTTPQGRNSPSSPPQLASLPAVSFSRPFSRPPPPHSSSPSSSQVEPYTDAMSHIISATPPLEAARIRGIQQVSPPPKNRNGSVSSNSTGGSTSPRKIPNKPKREDDHFVFPVVRTVRSSTLDNPNVAESQNQKQVQQSRKYGTNALPRSSSTPQYF